MDFLRYAERAAALVNTRLEGEEDLRAYLADRPYFLDRLGPRDLPAVRRLQAGLRGLFGEPDARTVERLNDLLERHPVSPYVSGHDAQTWHLHVSERRSSVAQTLAAEGLMGLAVVFCDLGPGRFGVCDGAGCGNAFVDTSPNRARRYCSERCSSRANVAAFRARRRTVTKTPAKEPR